MVVSTSRRWIELTVRVGVTPVAEILTIPYLLGGRGLGEFTNLNKIQKQQNVWMWQHNRQNKNSKTSPRRKDSKYFVAKSLFSSQSLSVGQLKLRFILYFEKIVLKRSINPPREFYTSRYAHTVCAVLTLVPVLKLVPASSFVNFHMFVSWISVGAISLVLLHRALFIPYILQCGDTLSWASYHSLSDTSATRWRLVSNLRITRNWPSPLASVVCAIPISFQG